MPAGEATLRCPACDADFGPDAAWGPVTNARGEWTPRPVPRPPRELDLAYAFLGSVLRFFRAGIAWIVVVALLVHSPLPYGAGATPFLVLLCATAAAVCAWAAVPFVATSRRRFAARRGAA
ncbi:MAG: hypothetical protein U1F48_17255 [Burkholderiales bacterium]